MWSQHQSSAFRSTGQSPERSPHAEHTPIKPAMVSPESRSRHPNKKGPPRRYRQDGLRVLDHFLCLGLKGTTCASGCRNLPRCYETSCPVPSWAAAFDVRASRRQLSPRLAIASRRVATTYVGGSNKLMHGSQAQSTSSRVRLGTRPRPPITKQRTRTSPKRFV